MCRLPPPPTSFSVIIEREPSTLMKLEILFPIDFVLTTNHSWKVVSFSAEEIWFKLNFLSLSTNHQKLFFSFYENKKETRRTWMLKLVETSTLTWSCAVWKIPSPVEFQYFQQFDHIVLHITYCNTATVLSTHKFCVSTKCDMIHLSGSSLSTKLLNSKL